VTFCSSFDETLARHGPPAVFLFDPEGQLRFDAEWTRDAWSRAPEQPRHEPFELPATASRMACWVLARDRDSGWVSLVLVTSPELLAHHPRLDLRRVSDVAEGRAVRASLGAVPVAKGAW
jgi:hypothetical protein